MLSIEVVTLTMTAGTYGASVQSTRSCDRDTKAPPATKSTTYNVSIAHIIDHNHIAGGG